MQNSTKCPFCKGTGLICVDEYKRIYRECDCSRNRVIAERLLKAGLTLNAMKKTFKTFKESVSPEARRMKDIATGFVIRFNEIQENKQDRNSLALFGQSGAGKTHLLIAIINSLSKQGIDMQYFSYPEVMTFLKQNVMEKVYTDYMDKYKKCDLLVVDDLFKNGYTESDKRIFFEILNSRVINHKSMAISSELLVNDLCKIDEALGSRIKEITDRFRYEIVGSQHNYRLKN